MTLQRGSGQGLLISIRGEEGVAQIGQGAEEGDQEGAESEGEFGSIHGRGGEVGINTG